MLDLDVMLGEREGRFLGLGCGCELLFMHDVLAVAAVSERQAPVAGMRLHDKIDVVVMRFVAMPRGHESQYRGCRPGTGDTVSNRTFAAGRSAQRHKKALPQGQHRP